MRFDLPHSWLQDGNLRIGLSYHVLVSGTAQPTQSVTGDPQSLFQLEGRFVSLVLEFIKDRCEDRLFDQIALAFVLLPRASPLNDDCLPLGSCSYTPREPMITCRDKDQVIETSTRQTVGALLTIRIADQLNPAS